MTQAIQTQLYDRDFVAWCDDTVAKLSASQLESLDVESLIEEIKGLANRERRELESRLRTLLAHLLKRIYVHSVYDYRGWENTVSEQRSELELLLKHSPSLRIYFERLFDETWDYALKRTRKNYPEAQFPNSWPFSREVEVLLSGEFWAINPD